MTYYKKTPIDLKHVKRAKELVIQAEGLRDQGGDATKEICLLLVAVIEMIAHSDGLVAHLAAAEAFIGTMSAVVN